MDLFKKWPYSSIGYVVSVIIFLGVAIFFLVTEHRAHLLGALPYLLLGLCIVMHLFGGHGHSGNGHSGHINRKGGDE